MPRLVWIATIVAFVLVAEQGIAKFHAFTLSSNIKEGLVIPPSGWKIAIPKGWIGSAPDPNPDENEPDMSAWKLFAEINKTSPSQHQVGPSKATTNDAIWETWADNELTFPASPDPLHPPKWPSDAKNFPLKRLAPPAQNLLRQHLQSGQPFDRKILRAPSNSRTLLGGEGDKTIHMLSSVGGTEEVRRNKKDFEFIADNKLFYQEGLAAAFAAAKPLVFPVESIEIKARWKPIQESDKANYHWNYDRNGDLFGLVALHIMSKRLPNWTWATWEWVGNAGRCDYTGCRDEFGVTPHEVQANTPLGGVYPPETLTSALISLFSSAGLSDEWKNYRLKGTQTLFTDTTGQPTLLGNSVTENGFVQSSSCITCHGQASVDSGGNPNPSVGFTTSKQSTNGPLLPTMFSKNGKLQYFPIDFIWSILEAQPAS
ncbi:MAG TPA: hypothetical protein VN634_02305 [Candidatus Limnocylindrales bacterium]|nr:hypothetical protein [Candidatus Limnocylindrales bacterium]